MFEKGLNSKVYRSVHMESESGKIKREAEFSAKCDWRGQLLTSFKI